MEAAIYILCIAIGSIGVAILSFKAIQYMTRYEYHTADIQVAEEGSFEIPETPAQLRKCKKTGRWEIGTKQVSHLSDDEFFNVWIPVDDDIVKSIMRKKASGKTSHILINNHRELLIAI